MLVITRGRADIGDSCEARIGQRHNQRTHRVADRKAHMPKQRVVEFSNTLGSIRIARRFHFLENKRMATDRSLTEDDQAARQNVRAFHGDGDRNDLVAAAQIILWTEADTFAAMDIHRVVGDLAAHFGNVILEHCRGHRRLLATVDGASSHAARGIHRIGQTDHTC